MIESIIIFFFFSMLLYCMNERQTIMMKRLDLAEEMIHDLANQYMILLRVRVNNEVIELRPEMALKEKLH